MKRQHPPVIKQQPALPAWFDAVFAHIGPADRAIAERLWFEEPTLQLMSLILDSQRPEHIKFRRCPRCDHRHLSWRPNAMGVITARCVACDYRFSSTHGTPFFRLLPRNWPKLYGVLVTLWGPWTPDAAWPVAGCLDSNQFVSYRRKLAPLFDELAEGTALVSRPAFRLGFTPAQQGVRCPHCRSPDLRYRRRNEPDNPYFACLACGRETALFASRRQSLPLRAPVCRPGEPPSMRTIPPSKQANTHANTRSER